MEHLFGSLWACICSDVHDLRVKLKWFSLKVLGFLRYKYFWDTFADETRVHYVPPSSLPRFLWDSESLPLSPWPREVARSSRAGPLEVETNRLWLKPTCSCMGRGRHASRYKPDKTMDDIPLFLWFSRIHQQKGKIRRGFLWAFRCLFATVSGRVLGVSCKWITVCLWGSETGIRAQHWHWGAA